MKQARNDECMHVGAEGKGGRREPRGGSETARASGRESEGERQGGKKDGMNEQTDGEQETEKENVKERERERRGRKMDETRGYLIPRVAHT